MVLKNDNEKMSDHSESGSEDAKYDNENEANGSSNDICRDFLRNVCKRGKRCKYRHPNTNEAKDLRRTQDYTFCHDYQNNGCRRPNCKFLHCTREEEEFCRQTGQLPVRLQQGTMIGVGTGTGSSDLLKGSIPICKDNLKGECHRGTTCKFRHVSIAEFEYQLRKAEGRAPVPPVGNAFRDGFDRFDRFDYDHENTKRRRLDRDFPGPGPDGFNSFERFSPNSRPLSYQLIEDENTMLRRKVEELKKQVADLTATNEVLLEQNARYRVSKSSILHTLNSTGIQPMQAASLNPLNTSLAQQIALNSDLVSQQALQQRIVREMAGPPAQCSIATPATLNTASLSINGPTIVPVSHPQTDLRLPPSVSCMQTQSIPQNLAQAQNTSLVSYPIVSQSMRMTASSLAH